MTDKRSMEHEEGVVRAFVVPHKRRRLVELLVKPKRRADVLRTLPHFRDLDLRFARRVPSSAGPDEILAELRSRGAPVTCYVISEDQRLDGCFLPLSEALPSIYAWGSGTFVSCLPGRLAYFEGEEPGERWILER